MSSNINPTNINGAYPIAGQDNDTQGFRDNFTNIRNNLIAAKTEIEELQSKAVLKSQLTSGSGTVDNNFNYEIQRNVTSYGFVKPAYQVPPNVPNTDTTTGPVTVSFVNGDFQYLKAGGPIEITFADWPTALNTYATLRMLVKTSPTLDTITLDPKVTIGANNLPGAVGLVVTPTVAGAYLFEFSTYDAGVNVIVSTLNYPS